MDKSKKSYEQYCSVLGCNIVVEESIYNGIRTLKCINEQNCAEFGGCKNRHIRTSLENSL